jgi:hypothetical protein
MPGKEVLLGRSTDMLNCCDSIEDGDAVSTSTTNDDLCESKIRFLDFC